MVPTHNLYCALRKFKDNTNYVRDKGFEQSIPLDEWSASYQLVGEVTAYQGNDG